MRRLFPRWVMEVVYLFRCFRSGGPTERCCRCHCWKKNKKRKWVHQLNYLYELSSPTSLCRVTSIFTWKMTRPKCFRCFWIKRCYFRWVHQQYLKKKNERREPFCNNKLTQHREIDVYTFVIRETSVCLCANHCSQFSISVLIMFS